MRLPIPPMPPPARVYHDYFGTLIAIRRPGNTLANKAIELINVDRRCENLFLTSSRAQ